MAERAPPANPSRGGRGQSIHTGANDVGLLAPTPLVFGLAGAIALPAAASAAEAGASTPSAPADAPSAPASSSGPDTPAALEPAGLVAAAPSSDTGGTSSLVTSTQGFVTEAAPYGSTSSLPVAMQFAPHSPLMPAATPAQADVSEAVSAVRASADALTGALQNLVAQLDGPAPAGIDQVTGAIDALGQTVEGSLGAITSNATTLLEDVQTTATDLAAGALDAVGSTVETLGETVGTTLDTATGQVGALLDGTTDALDSTISSVAEVAQGTVSAIAPVVESTVDTAASLTAPLVETVADAAAPVTEAVTDLLGIGGPDPAGGIATLTGMLADTDGFAVVAPDALDLAAPVFASVGDLPDTLETLGDVVTTTIDHDDGGSLLGGVIDTGSSLLGGDDKHGLGGLFDGDHGHG